MRSVGVAVVAMVVLSSCNIGESIGESATELGQNAADRARRAAIDRLEEDGDCRSLKARLDGYEASGLIEVTEYAREAMKRLGCDD